MTQKKKTKQVFVAENGWARFGSIKRNPNEVAIKGECRVFRDSTELFGGDQSESFVSAVLHDPTWRELMVLANRAIVATNDYHHVYISNTSESQSARARGLSTN